MARRARDGVHGSDELPVLLPGADVVVNLLPLTEATRGSFGARDLAAMREGALYANAGRGATTDTGALVAALQSTGASAPCSTSSNPSRCPPTSAVGGARRDDQPAQRGRHPGRRAGGVGLAAAQLRRYAAGERWRTWSATVLRTL